MKKLKLKEEKINQVILGDSKEKLKELADNSVDSVVTDPPYELGFMGKKWDSTGIAYDVELWKEVYRVLKPGGHLLSFGGTRTYHRMACAIEDAGFEIRDQIQWIYSSGFPAGNKDISVAIDKKLGEEREVIGKRKHPTLKDTSKLEEQANASHGGNMWSREWDITAPTTLEAQKYEGWGSKLKPANEPILLARKPFKGSIADNVLNWNTGGINIGGCKIGNEKTTYSLKGGENLNKLSRPDGNDSDTGKGLGACGVGAKQINIGAKIVVGRFPANVIHDGSEEVINTFPTTKINGQLASAATFFYSAKTSKKERTCNGQVENKHPTVKPIALISYLCRLVTPPGGTLLDPFAGSGTTAIACMREGFNYILIELEEDSYNTCLDRINAEQ